MVPDNGRTILYWDKEPNPPNQVSKFINDPWDLNVRSASEKESKRLPQGKGSICKS